MGLTDIADRLTPSAPIELAFGAQIAGTGVKMTTLIGRRAGGTGVDYEAYDVLNVGDSAKAKAEVEAKAGVGSEIAKMAKLFVDTNAIAGRSIFPPFRILLLPANVTNFGPNDEAFLTLKGLRSDLIVSPFALGDVPNTTKLLGLAASISGADRDQTGQFGTHVVAGTKSALETALTELAAFNDRNLISAVCPDTSSDTFTITGDITEDSAVLTNLSSVTGILLGATIASQGIPDDSKVIAIGDDSVTLDKAATSVAQTAGLTVTNPATSGPAILATYQAAVLGSLPFPYRPVQGLEVGGMPQPKNKADRIYVDANGPSEAILRAGGSPFVILPGGKMGMLRARLNYTKLPDGVTEATSYIDFIDIAKLQDFKETMYGVIQNPPFNNNPGGALLDKDLGNLLNDEAVRVYMDFQKRGAFQAGSRLTKKIVTQNSETSRGTLEFLIPVNAVPGAYVFKGRVVGVTDFDFTY